MELKLKKLFKKKTWQINGKCYILLPKAQERYDNECVEFIVQNYNKLIDCITKE